MYSDISGYWPNNFIDILTSYIKWFVNDVKTLMSGVVKWDSENNEIQNSFLVTNPHAVAIYSVYLKYFSDSKSHFKGSASGIAAEWHAHNLLFYGFVAFNEDGKYAQQIHQAMHAGIGGLIIDEYGIYLESGNRNRLYVFALSHGIEIFLTPAGAIYDLTYYLNRQGDDLYEN